MSVRSYPGYSERTAEKADSGQVGGVRPLKKTDCSYFYNNSQRAFYIIIEQGHCPNLLRENKKRKEDWQMSIAWASFVGSIIYMVVVIFIGWYTSRQNATTEKYYAAERSMRWPLIGMMLFAFLFAGPAITGPIQNGYSQGIEVMWACMGMAIGCIWFIMGGVSDLYRVSGRHGAMSVPGVFAYRFDEKVRLMMMVYMVIVFTMFFTSNIAALASLFEGMLGINYTILAFGIALVYVAMAWFGFEGVAWQNILHNVMMVVGFLVMLILIVKAAGGFGTMWQELPRSFWNPFAPSLNISLADALSSIFQCAVSGTIITCAFVGRNRRETRIGFYFAAALSAVYALFGPLIGMASRIFYGPDQDPVMIPAMITTQFGFLPGVLLTIGIVAATASTSPGLVMVVVNALVNDLAPAVKKDITDKQKMFYTRILLFVVAAFAAWLSATFVDQLMRYFFLAFAINGISGVLLWMSGFVKKMDSNSCFVGLILGIVAVIGWFAFGRSDIIQPFWIGFIGPIVTLIMSAMKKEPDPQWVAYNEERQYLKDNPEKEYEEYLEQLAKFKEEEAAKEAAQAAK
jgi:Na+/proline symporter